MKPRGVVIDASFALDLILRQPVAALVRTDLVTWITQRRPLLVPSHFWLEVVNSLSARHHWGREAIVEALYELDAFGLTTVEIDRPLLLLAAFRMDEYRLSGYDAAYIVTAEVAGADIATHDRHMDAVAAQLGLVPSTPHRLGEEPAPYGSDVAPSTGDFSWVGRYLADLRAAAIRDAEALATATA